ncbi:uncharacterized protein LOC116304687 isoform X1 [Actinia tenebrosa]|uniref:Uncharacterized protein LOC116304687 isoform X1 n=1 Tax=Actinia tenebrosa TaxID=6105 RepID=A0A6P8ITI8_ACTTE|nr:uncharacterized protein LOC116304687 isoform X1 [Actinia tenebrosa]XP_031570319.1 uncharacterized protein LOC116304687 isoform X1 [Actinia tenebrosa]
MEHRVKELEEHIFLMKRNSLEAVAFLKNQLFECLDTKKILEEEINSIIDKHPISPPTKYLVSCLKEVDDTSSKRNSLNEENELLKIQIQRLKEDNIRKDQRIQEMQEQVKHCQELLSEKAQKQERKEMLIEDLKSNATEQKSTDIMETQAIFIKKRNIFTRGAHRVSKRCRQALAYCRFIVHSA